MLFLLTALTLLHAEFQFLPSGLRLRKVTGTSAPISLFNTERGTGFASYCWGSLVDFCFYLFHLFQIVLTVSQQ